MDELKYQLSKIDFTKYSGDEIEESVFVSEIHSFARSQAEEFTEWCSENGYEYQLNGVWTNRNFTDPVGTRFRYTTSGLYSQFLAHQKKQLNIHTNGN